MDDFFPQLTPRHSVNYNQNDYKRQANVDIYL